MTVSAQTPYSSQAANGVTTSFPFAYKVRKSTDLVVTLVDADGTEDVQALGVDYTVSGVGSGSGGTVDFLAAPANGLTVKTRRVTSLSRSIDYQSNGDLLASTINGDVDAVWLALQELLAGTQAPSNVLRAPVGEQIDTLPMSSLRTDRMLGFNILDGQAELTPFTMTQVASAIAAAYSGATGPLDALSFIAAGTGARTRTAQAKARDWVNVADFGAIGDGTAHLLSERYATLAAAQVDYPFVTALTQTIDWAAAEAAKRAGAGAVFVSTLNLVVRDPIVFTTGDPIFFGLNGRFINAHVSKITVDHAGTGVWFENQTGLGSGLWNMVVQRSGPFFAQGVNIALDSNGAGPSTIVSHCDLDGVTSYGGQTGVSFRGLIFGHIGRLNILNATTGMAFPGVGFGYVACNVVSFENVSIQACTTAIALEADAGCNLHFKNLDIESCTDTISIAAGCSVANLTIDTLWLEDNANGMKMRAGSHIKLKTVRHNNAAGINLFDSATFGAKNVEVETVIASANDFAVGTANASVQNVEIITNGGWASTAGNTSRSYANGAEYTPALSSIQVAGSSVMDVMRQSGRITKNYLLDWNILASGNWGIGSATNLAAATDPLGGNTAYSFGGSVFGGCNAMPVVANGQQKELVVWAYGSGRVKLQNWGRTFYWDINTTHWVRLPLRVVIEDAATQAMDGFNCTLTPSSVGSLRIWRPGVYEGFDSIDSRPGTVSGAYEGGYIDFATYPAAAREGKKLIFHGTASPAAGTYMNGDRVVNTTSTAGGTEGWVCTTAGTVGAGAVFKTYGTIAP